MEKCPHMSYACPHHDEHLCADATDCVFIAHTVGAALRIVANSAVSTTLNTPFAEDVQLAKQLLEDRVGISSSFWSPGSMTSGQPPQ